MTGKLVEKCQKQKGTIIMKYKNSFKRKAAFLLALSMVCSFPQAIGAAAYSSIGPRQISKKNHMAATESQAIGRIEVALTSYAELKNDVEFTAELTNTANNEVQTATFTAGSEGKEKGHAVFKNLADGEYIIKVSAPGFAAFSQNITVEQKMYTVNLTADFCNGYEYVDGGLHPGVLKIGDVDGNGNIDDTDKDILIDQIEGAINGTIEENNYSTDLNRDNAIDLIDLTYLSRGYKEDNKNTAAHIEESVSPDAIVPEISENTQIEGGSVEELLNGEGSVVLAPTGGEEISPENPVSIGFDLGGSEESAAKVDGIAIDTNAENPITQATISVNYIDEDGSEKSVEVPYVEGIHHILKESEVYAEIDADGKLNVHLGAQVAVKKVTLTIMGMKKNAALAEISKVEFVNGMENRIPEPEMDIPENLKAKAGSEQFTVTWEPCLNVKNYQVKVEQGEKSEIIDTAANSLTVTSFNGGDVKNYSIYKVSVQSVNGTWSSGYCDTVNVTPKPEKRPDKPDNVSATGKYLSINVNWKKMDDTRSYNVYYKERSSDEAYAKIEGITGTSCLIPDLKNLTEYEIYVTGVNELGESPQSIHCATFTVDPKAAEVPKYNMINRDESGRPGKSHIVSVTRNGGVMVDSELDAGLKNTAWGAVDNDPASYYKKTTWDDGGFNNLGGNGLTYEFDDVYKIDTIVCTGTDGMQYSYVKARWWDVNENSQSIGASCKQARDSKGNTYYIVKLDRPVEAKKIQIGFARYLSGAAYNLITVSDTYFYRYDEIRNAVMGLYVDDLHTVLKDDVTQQTIDDLRERIDIPDEFGNINPDREVWLRELDTAEKLLNAKALKPAVEIHADITSKDSNRGFSGLNAWQPLGITAAAGEKITVYVGHPSKKTGEKTTISLVATQYHGESNNIQTCAFDLKVGANEITLRSGNLAGYEAGGALYIHYWGNNSKDRYSVRVNGGAEVPILDLYKVTDENERMERAVDFVEKLDSYVPEMQSLHDEIHKGSENGNVNYDYDDQNCILGASDILLDEMMLSLPAQQMLAGMGTGSVEERAGKMLDSMTAMEDMMYLFYQHKGLNDSVNNALHQTPKSHLNIRYQRMFSGAFMYASGNHIGIEWGSTPSMMNGVPIESDENGKYVSGNYFGWGIGHEIGHNINQGVYAVAEITNNYFAQLAQAKDTNEGMRFQYQNIYDKVTSGTKGNCSNIATQLGMYWQLHLAYDSGLNYKTYSDYNEQLANLFYARVDTYARNANAAPAPNGIKLAIGNNTDQNLMRLACAAANKNILEFFERWGKTPDATTIEYANQFEKETRAIFFANDDSRVYALNGKGSVLSSEGTTSAIGGVSVNIGAVANKVELGFTSKDIPESDILGYEVIRCTISGGEVEETPVGFSTSSSFTDTVSTINNRAVYYKVTLIDQYLNRSASFTTKMVKIEHDGSMDKENWTISVNGMTAEAEKHNATEEMPCNPTTDDPAQLAIDNDLNTVYTPNVTKKNAEIVIDFNKTVTASGMKYTTGEAIAAAYQVFVLADGEWKLAADGMLRNSDTVYFANADKQYISTYSITAVKLVLPDSAGQTLSIAELDVLAPTGDNVDFRRTENENVTVIGTLAADYKYGENDADVIPKDSLVFTGSYKGNPAYNVVMMFDDQGNVVGGKDSENNLVSQQIILADVPDNSNIANVSDGTWIYWIEPDQMENIELPETVRVELYRVNNAETNEGERLVSDSLFEEVPETLPVINFEK